MTDTAHYHPDETLLRSFVAGGLPIGINLAVSSHIDQCHLCQQLVPELELDAGEAWLDEEPDLEKETAKELGALFQSIIKAPAPATTSQTPAAAIRASVERHAVRLRDRAIRLPRLLDRIARAGLQWKEIANGIHQALLDVDSQTKCEYIYMDPGARVPTHTHLGSEYMLVLDGTIVDNFGSYGTGDFVARHQQDRHGQVTEEGCVCLFVTDAPLIFSEGKARLLNPINRLRFWWAKGRK